jgi:hypothetical protein
MKASTYLVTAVALAASAAATTIGHYAERDQPKKDYVLKSLDPKAPRTEGATITTVKYG